MSEVRDYYTTTEKDKPLRSVWADSVAIHLDIQDTTVHLRMDDFEEVVDILNQVRDTIRKESENNSSVS